MPSAKNIAAVEELKQRLSRSTVIIGTGFSGLNVAAMTGLRAALREKGIEYRVVKNTLATIAAHEVGRPEVADILREATGLVIGYDDPLEPAKALEEYRRATRISLTIRGAVLDGRVLSAAEVSSLATLPPREALVASLAGQLQGLLGRLATALSTPTQQLTYALNAPIQGLVTVMQGYVEKGQESGG